jgi:N-acetyl-gamma-glutamyl-phosphate reductase
MHTGPVTTRIFIDGQEGTTGLQIHERLRGRSDFTLLEIPGERRKEPELKRELLREADIAVLCLPDAAAVETVRLAGPRTRLLDASTAHRVNPEWSYGLPELDGAARESIRNASKVANPGCWPTGFLLLVRPLIDAGLLPRDYPISLHGQSGYSGGGKPMIAAFQQQAREGHSPAWTVRPYGLQLQHKHVPEMQRYALLQHTPLFCPSVGDYYQGMLVHVPLHTRTLTRRVRPEDVQAIYDERYARERFVRVLPVGATGTLGALEQGCLSATALNGTNNIELFVFGHADQLLLTARLDNLGKGASGAAVQNLNLMLGREEATSLGDESGALSLGEGARA